MPSVHTPPSPSSGGLALAPAPLAHAGPPASVVTATPVRTPDDAPRTNGSLALAEPVAAEPSPARNAPVTEAFEVTSTPRADTIPPSTAKAATKPADKEDESLVAWRALIDRVRKVNPAVAATLDLGIPVTITPDKLVIGMEDESFEDVRAEQTDARTVLTTEARAYFGKNTEVAFERAARGSKVASVAYLDAAKRKQMLIEARAEVENHVLVQHAIRALGAELKDVKLPAREE